MRVREKSRAHLRPLGVLLIFCGVVIFVGGVGAAISGEKREGIMGALLGQYNIFLGLYFLRQSRKASK